MAMNFLDLVGPKSKPGSIHNWVNYKKTPVEVVLEEAQTLIYSQLRVREMRVAGTLTLAVGASDIALPERFLEPIALKDREGIRLIPSYSDSDCTYVSQAELMLVRTYESDGSTLISGIPSRVAIFGEKYQFDVKASVARTYDHGFYQSPELLSADNRTNWLTTRYPHMLRIACLASAASFMKDDQEEQKQLTKLTNLVVAANAESDLSSAS